MKALIRFDPVALSGPRMQMLSQRRPLWVPVHVQERACGSSYKLYYSVFIHNIRCIVYLWGIVDSPSFRESLPYVHFIIKGAVMNVSSPDQA